MAIKDYSKGSSKISISENAIRDFQNYPAIKNILKNAKNKNDAIEKFSQIEPAYRKKVLNSMQKKSLIASAAGIDIAIFAFIAILIIYKKGKNIDIPTWVYDCSEKESSVIHKVFTNDVNNEYYGSSEPGMTDMEAQKKINQRCFIQNSE